MAKWLDAWMGAREANGQTSTRENRGHCETHIATAIGGQHLRDWTADDLRKLSVHHTRDRHTGEDKSIKTKQTRRLTLEPAILPLLRTMHAEAVEEGHGGPTDPIAELTSERDLARGQKRWLRKAGVERPELFSTDATRQAIRFHDMRATAITWMAVRGDAPQVIQSRAGHTDYTTTLGSSARQRHLPKGSARCSLPCPSWHPIGPRIGPSFEKWYLSIRNHCGVDGTRTRGLRRDRPAL